MHNILITSAGKRVALVRAFKEVAEGMFSGIKVFTSDMRPEMAPAGYASDGCFEVPRCTVPDYADVIFDICKANNVGLVVPTIDTELLCLSKNRERFKEQGIFICVSSFDFVSICRDKRKTMDFLKSIDIRSPHIVDKDAPTFPMFAKPYDGSRSANIHVIKDEEDLTEKILHDQKLMFMEYIDKNQYKEFTIDMYYGTDNNLKCLVPRERIQVRAGEINKGRTHKGFLMDYIKQRFEHIDGCVGCICLQLFYNHDTHDVVGIEINPRFGGGYPLSYAAGANFPKMLLQEYFCNQQICYTDSWKDNMLMLRYDDAIFI